MKKFKFKNLKLGQKTLLKIKLTSKMHNQYVRLSGDDSPFHTSKKFVNRYGFKDKIIHGMLIGAHYSKLIGTLLPGNFSIEGQMNIHFHYPCYVNDIIEIKAKIVKLIKFNKLCDIEIKTFNQKKKLVSSAITKIKLME